MSHYSDPTANMALGSIHREWKRMLKLAVWLREHEADPSAERSAPASRASTARF